MRAWISCLLILLVMLATLSTAPRLNLPAISGFVVASMTLMTIGLLLSETLLRRLWLGKQPASGNQSFKKTPKQTLSTTPKRFNLLQIVTVILLVFTAGLHTMRSVQIELNNDLADPIRVLATVHPVGLSDSNFFLANNIQTQDIQAQDRQAQDIQANNTETNPHKTYPSDNTSHNTNYRQVAVIKSFRPLRLSEQDKLNKTDTQQNLLSHLNGTQVLLSARQARFPKNKGLPAGFSTDFIGLNSLQPTQSTQMLLELKPLPSAKKGFVHQWLRARHINAQAQIIAYQPAFERLENIGWQTRLNQWRWQVREHFIADNWQRLSPQEQQAKAVTLSLFTGDRALINKQTKELYQLAGISHLLAISGTHVLFLAIILSTLVLMIVNRYLPHAYNHLPKAQLRWLVMVIGALVYALFTGFDVPSARTVYMLVAVGISRLLLLDISARQVLLIVAVLMAVADPYVLWQAGFWLSFVAVMLLISYDLSVNQRANREQFNYYHSSQKSTTTSPALSHSLPAQLVLFAKLQLWIFLALLPLSLLLFGKVSLWGVLVNLFAIGLYGWIIVPINLLAGMLYPLLPSLADGLWHFVSGLVELTHNGLAWLVDADKPSQSWLYTNINAGMMLIMGLIALPLLFPSRSVSRLWSLPPLTLLAILLFNQANPESHKQTNHYQTRLTLLNTSLSGENRYVTTTLLTHNDDNWLIVANHQPSHNSNYKSNRKSQLKQSPSPAESIELSKQWQEQLNKSGVSSLTGIIMQTPTPNLLEASKLLKNNMPIGFMWLAGNKQLAKLHTDATNSIPQYVLSCDSGRQWSSSGNNPITITAMTGWQDIDDAGVWSCAIQITSNQPIFLDHQYPLHWLSTSGKKNSSQHNEQQDKPNNQPDSIFPSIAEVPNQASLQRSPTLPMTNQLLLNAGDKNARLWQLWALLCSSTDTNSPAETLTNAKTTTTLLTHSANDLPSKLLQRHPSIQTWALLDQPTQYNQQQLPKTLLDWHNQTYNQTHNQSHKQTHQ